MELQRVRCNWAINTSRVRNLGTTHTITCHCHDSYVTLSKMFVVADGMYIRFLVFVQLLRCLTLWPYGPQHSRFPCPSLSPRICSNSCPLSCWCHPIISSSLTPFSSCLQSFPASWSFPMSQLFTSGGQNIEAGASASVLSMNIQDWFPLGLTGLISFQCKGLSVFSSTTVLKHQFFGSQPSLWSNSHIHRWLLEKS